MRRSLASGSRLLRERRAYPGLGEKQRRKVVFGTYLTSKEWAIAALVSQGSTNTEIAGAIHAPESLVKGHLRRILKKTGCWNRVEIALWYLENGVETERRFSDRRMNAVTSEERRRGRRFPLERCQETKKQHHLNLDQ